MAMSSVQAVSTSFTLARGPCPAIFSLDYLPSVMDIMETGW